MIAPLQPYLIDEVYFELALDDVVARHAIRQQLLRRFRPFWDLHLRAAAEGQCVELVIRLGFAQEYALRHVTLRPQRQGGRIVAVHGTVREVWTDDFRRIPFWSSICRQAMGRIAA